MGQALLMFVIRNWIDKKNENDYKPSETHFSQRSLISTSVFIKSLKLHMNFINLKMRKLAQKGYVLPQFIFNLSELPWRYSNKESAYHCRRFRFDPWVWKIPWRRKWHSSILAWKIPRTEEPGGLQSMVGYSLVGKQWDTTGWLSTHAHTLVEFSTLCKMPQEEKVVGLHQKVRENHSDWSPGRVGSTCSYIYGMD